MESSKTTVKHIKHVASDPQAAHINLTCHQCTELPDSRFNRKQKKPFKCRQDTNKQYYNEEKQRKRVPQVHKKYNNYQAYTSHERCTILRDSDVQLVNTNAEIATNMVISVVCATRREKSLTRKHLWSQDHPKHINFRLVQFICKIPYVASQNTVLAKIHSACKYN